MQQHIVGYGSLMSHKSLRKTISDKRFKPVIVKGYKRIFNLAVSKNSDVLNLKKSPKSKFNGLMFQIDNQELNKIKKRESGYELEEVYVYNFKTNKRLNKCFVVVDHHALDKYRRKPKKDYFILCREAAYHINKKFGEFWDNTTFIYKNKKVSQWLKKNPSFETIYHQQ
ncbi:MAG: gamma-glutamylcyclotransferase family protein [Candidatus Nanoarchaeia archaeon]|nr:gamma-glutamylcyclotransferase family protein [Candidatus Nanoarchaeia archaeon]